ncbi:uncharacterized protein LOC119976539 isoform X1 [Scyliorhinus canicula]|uniref:uncharacterized protein LOC119976539 isoform X1 n=1 Tax=Scyliorhinus canicula TaxID=7830 RepID=UPI0018F71651|nr:uncharacterized protein LOC119976539 isoform X1 [Scyliorhinus canicula]
MALSRQLTLLQLILVATHTGGKMNFTVYQFPPFITAAEGESVILKCALGFEGKHSLIGAARWTRGKPGGYKLDNSPFYKNRLERSDSASIGNNRIFINISDLLQDDSDTYYCHVSFMGTEERCGNGTHLHVKRKVPKENNENPHLILGLGGALVLLGLIVIVLISGLTWQNKVILRLNRHSIVTNATDAPANLQPATQVHSIRGSDEDDSVQYAKVNIKKGKKTRTMNCDTRHVE